MSLNSELALAARVLNSVNDQLPADCKLDQQAEWERLVDRVEMSLSEGSALLAIIEWREELKARTGCRPVLSK